MYGRAKLSISDIGPLLIIQDKDRFARSRKTLIAALIRIYRQAIDAYVDLTFVQNRTGLGGPARLA